MWNIKNWKPLHPNFGMEGFALWAKEVTPQGETLSMEQNHSEKQRADHSKTGQREGRIPPLRDGRENILRQRGGYAIRDAEGAGSLSHSRAGQTASARRAKVRVIARIPMLAQASRRRARRRSL